MTELLAAAGLWTLIPLSQKLVLVPLMEEGSGFWGWVLVIVGEEVGQMLGETFLGESAHDNSPIYQGDVSGFFRDYDRNGVSSFGDAYGCAVSEAHALFHLFVGYGQNAPCSHYEIVLYDDRPVVQGGIFEKYGLQQRLADACIKYLTGIDLFD